LLASFAFAPAWLLGAGMPHVSVASSRVTEVRVTERDFHISAPKQVSHGDLLVRVVNKGLDNHELVVVRATSTRLPLRSDGVTVDEAALLPITEPSLDPGAPGSVRELRLHLSPGRYVFFCNMAGHFMSGMHADLVVR
jgi:uncharacterized cupredoxin-like copper-binding protein